MSRFIVRRLLAMVRGDVRDLAADVPAVRGDPERQPGVPARRAHGHAAGDPCDRGQIRLQPADLRPVPADDEEHLHQPGVLLHAGLQRALGDQGGTPGDAVAGVRRRLHLALHVDPRRHRSRDQGGQIHRSGADDPGDVRRLVPAVLPRSGADLLPRIPVEHLPVRRLREVHHEPESVVRAPGPALVHALGAVHRLLLAGPALDDPRHDQRGLRAHRPRQGPVRSPGAAPPHAA